MDDLNKKARLHSAGATVLHVSPFDNLPTHKNGSKLSHDFINKWGVPFYMRIASHGDQKWIDAIKEVKNEITQDICLLLLGDFNWRSRLVGSYFAGVKCYREFIDIIGTHLLKSEVCCVGHIYALILSFFNDEHCIQYLNKYLDYYLTKPSLYFDQNAVMTALLYLDKENKTDHFNRHINNWKILQEERKIIEKRRAQEVAKMLEQSEREKYLLSFQSDDDKKGESFSTEFFEKQIEILRELNQYNG